MSIVVTNLHHTYEVKGRHATVSLRCVNLCVAQTEFVAIVGPSGAGKSTLLQHLIGLLAPSRGSVVIDGLDVGAPGIDLNAVRSRVGLVFQHPEQQLFADTVAEDVAFGPRNLGCAPEVVEGRVRKALLDVGLNPESVRHRSPFALSGGEQRRVALAGVLAMGVGYLVLDEPTAGLDARGRAELWQLLRTLNTRDGVAIVIVTHDMDAAAHNADRVFVLDAGQVILQGEPSCVYRAENRALLEQIGLELPVGASLVAALVERGWSLPSNIVQEDDALNAVAEAAKSHG